MPEYRVKEYEHGKWNGIKPMVIKAENESAAAEQIYGDPLFEAGKPGQLCCEVWDPQFPEKKKQFYLHPDERQTYRNLGTI